MWGSIKGFFQRHKRTFFITGVVVAGSYLLGKYAKWRFTEWQRRQEMEYVEQARKQHHFESNLRTCSVTLFSLVPGLRDALLEKLNCEAITAKLRERPSNKLELWEELKVLSFTRTVASIYSSCMLFVFLRVQLNIVGGYMYLDSLILTGEATKGRQVQIAEGLQRRYLALVKYLLGDGLDFLVEEVKRTIEDILGDISLKEKFSHLELSRLINHIRQSLEFPNHSMPIKRSSPDGLHRRPFQKFMLPSDIESLCGSVGGIVDDNYRNVVEETLDILDSQDCNTVLKLCLDTGFAHVMSNIIPFFQAEELDLGNVDGLESVSSLSLPLAKIIPIINGQINYILSDSDNSYIQDLCKVGSAREFAANVYEAFSHEVD